EFDVVGGYKVNNIRVRRSERDKRVYLRASVEVEGKYRQYCDLTLAENLQNSFIAHFDGPLKLGLREINWSCTQKLVRDGELHDLCILVGTFDKANGCWEALSNRVIDQENIHPTDFPTDIHPVAEIEFPPARPGDKPLRERYELKERC